MTLRLSYATSAERDRIALTVAPYSLSVILFFSFVALTSLYYIFDNYSSLELVSTSVPGEAVILSYFHSPRLLSSSLSGLHPVSVYCFPFIYIFVVVTAISLVFCLSYNSNELTTFTFYCVVIMLAGTTMFFTSSLLVFFLAYETLLVPSFFILYNFAKTRRCVEAAYLMFFWTQFGALFLIFAFLYILILSGSASFEALSLLYLSPYEVNFLFGCLLFGFGVKLPIWPFYGWLPKAHVEASTNFSIFLSGVLVKFAFFGFLKCLVTIQLEPTFYFLYPFLTIGLVEASLKLFY